jgi:hypothetical protein
VYASIEVCVSHRDGLDQDCRTYGIAVPVPYFFCPTRVFILWRCIYTYLYFIWITIATKQQFILKSGAVRSGDWIFITGAPAWRLLEECVTMDKTFYSLRFERELLVVAALDNCKFSSLLHSSMRPLLVI